MDTDKTSLNERFPFEITINFNNKKLSDKEYVEIIGKSLDKENWKELENQGIIVKEVKQ